LEGRVGHDDIHQQLSSYSYWQHHRLELCHAEAQHLRMIKRKKEKRKVNKLYDIIPTDDLTSWRGVSPMTSRRVSWEDATVEVLCLKRDRNSASWFAHKTANRSYAAFRSVSKTNCISTACLSCWALRVASISAARDVHSTSRIKGQAWLISSWED